jgi:hypothetical protein
MNLGFSAACLVGPNRLCRWTALAAELRFSPSAPQARHVIEFSSARNICLDKLNRQLHTEWYVAGYN